MTAQNTAKVFFFTPTLTFLPHFYQLKVVQSLRRTTHVSADTVTDQVSFISFTAVPPIYLSLMFTALSRVICCHQTNVFVSEKIKEVT